MSGTGGHDFQIRVPIDDTHTYYVYYYATSPREGEDTNQAEEDIPVYHVPIAGVDGDGLPIWGQLDNNSDQDHFAWTSQGPRMNRNLEKLGQSDVGLILFRRMLNEQMQIVEDGGDPMNTVRDPAKNEIIWLPFDRMNDETIDGMRAIPKSEQSERRGRGEVIGSGSSGKFNPVQHRARQADRSPDSPAVPAVGAHCRRGLARLAGPLYPSSDHAAPRPVAAPPSRRSAAVEERCMRLEGVSVGTRLVTMSGDIVELLELTERGSTVRVRFAEILSGGDGAVGNEALMTNDDIATLDGTRFVGPPQTSSTSGA